jgi:hypothetical protein
METRRIYSVRVGIKGSMMHGRDNEELGITGISTTITTA